MECGFIPKPKSTPLLGEYDDVVRQRCQQLRTAGSAVNGRILSAIIESVLLREEPSLLKSKGGPIDPQSRGLIHSCFKRWGWVKRRSTSSRLNLSAREASEIKQRWTAEVNDVIRENQIRDDLIINFDEISAAVLPTESYTMNIRGAGDVTIAGNSLYVQNILRNILSISVALRFML